MISATSKTDGVRTKVPIPILVFSHTGIDKRMKFHKDPYDGKSRNRVYNTINNIDSAVHARANREQNVVLRGKPRHRQIHIRTNPQTLRPDV